MQLFVAASIAAAALCAWVSTAEAGDVAVGRSKSIACVSCHGAEGVSSYDTWPTIAGRPEAYLLVQLRAFRDGIRDNPWMSPMAKRLSDGDIEDLAAYFSALPERSDPHD